MTDEELTEITVEAEHERALAESMAESAARLARGETTGERARILSAIEDLTASLAERELIASIAEGFPHLSGVARIQRDIIRLMTRSITDLAQCAEA